MATVQAIEFNILDGVIYYHFNVLFDSQNWVLSKTYDDFKNLHADLEGVYEYSQLPYLTGEVRPWARLSPSTGEKRLGKLEGYLCEALATHFKPAIYDVSLPLISHPEKMIHISTFLFEFLDFAVHYRPPDITDEDAAKRQQKKAVEETEEDREARARLIEIQRLKLTAKDNRQRIARSTAAAERSTITSALRIQIPSFVIFERDRIEYTVVISLMGHVWNIAKRYSDFEGLHDELVSIYGAVRVPSLEESKVPFFRKLDAETGKLRQKFFETYFEDLLRDIDSWEPRGLLATFQVFAPPSAADGTGGGSTTIAVNKCLFDFLNFQENLQDLNADVAARVVRSQMTTLPEDVQRAIKAKKAAEQRLQVISVLEDRMRGRRVVSEADIDRLVEFLKVVQEDRDLINVVRFFATFGEVCRDLRELERYYAAATTKTDSGGGLPAAAAQEAAAPAAPAGSDNAQSLTSKQLGPLRVGRRRLVAINNGGDMDANASFAAASPRRDEFDLCDDADDLFETQSAVTVRTTRSTRTTRSGGGGGNGSDRNQRNQNSNNNVNDKGSPISGSPVGSPRGGGGGGGGPAGGPTPVKATSSSSSALAQKLRPEVPIGITSAQATRIAAVIFFNDTRIEVIKTMAEAFVDDAQWPALFGTLIYEWDTTRNAVEELLAAEDTTGKVIR